MVVANELDISVIIPTCNDGETLKKIIDVLHNQTPLPQEIVIVDSSTNDEVKHVIEESECTVPISHHFEKKAYPGKARNIGVSMTNSN